jgi:hypothetical protein
MPRAGLTAGRGSKNQDAPLPSRPEVLPCMTLEPCLKTDRYQQQPIASEDFHPRTRGWLKSEAERQSSQVNKAAPAIISKYLAADQPTQARILRPRKPSLQAKANVIAPSQPGGPSGTRRQSKGNARSIQEQTTAPLEVTGKRTRESSKKASEQARKDRFTVEKLYPETHRVTEPPYYRILSCVHC